MWDVGMGMGGVGYGWVKGEETFWLLSFLFSML